jgi:hypothetical protein
MKQRFEIDEKINNKESTEKPKALTDESYVNKQQKKYTDEKR